MTEKPSMIHETKAAASDPLSTVKEQSRILLEQLIQTYPAAFPPANERRINPLKLGIHKDLAPLIKEWGYTMHVLKYTLGGYTRQMRYQMALLKAPYRVDLQGKPAGDISEAHRQTAQEKVNIIKERRIQAQNSKGSFDNKQSLKKKPVKLPKPIDQQAIGALQRKLNRKAAT
jgi:sRNA-binding protein